MIRLEIGNGLFYDAALETDEPCTESTDDNAPGKAFVVWIGIALSIGVITAWWFA